MFGHCSTAISSFAEHARAEVRHDHRHAGETRRRGAASASGSPRRRSNGDGSPSFFRTPTVSTPQCTNTTAPWSRRGRKRHPDPLVVQTIAVHGGKQADAAQARSPSARRSRRADVPAQRVEHEEADEPRRMPRDRGGDGLFVAGDARDDRGPGDAVRDPARRPSDPRARRRCRDRPTQGDAILQTARSVSGKSGTPWSAARETGSRRNGNERRRAA